MTCKGYDTGRTIEDYKEMIHQNFGKNIIFYFQKINKESRLPSRVFEGFRVKTLIFIRCNVTRWVDEEGGSAFVGLEDTLEKIEIIRSIHTKERNDLYYKNVTAPMSLGHLRKLKEINIRHNKLLKFGNEWFGKGGNSVKSISLVSNSIYEIGNEAFVGLANLKYINLRSNNISALTRNMFPNPAEHLEQIDLMDNNITSFPEHIFTNMPSLNWLNLQGNRIKAIPESTWRPIWSTLSYLSLEYNPLSCDDHIEWMLEVKHPKYLFASCEYPKEFRGRNLVDLIEERQGLKE